MTNLIYSQTISIAQKTRLQKFAHFSFRFLSFSDFQGNSDFLLVLLPAFWSPMA